MGDVNGVRRHQRNPASRDDVMGCLLALTAAGETRAIGPAFDPAKRDGAVR